MTISIRYVFAGLCAALCVAQLAAAAGPVREQLSLDANWRFHLGDIPLNLIPGGQLRCRSGDGRSAGRSRRPVPTANLAVVFEISGPGNIIGVGNSDPNCHEPEKGNQRSLFSGLAQVIVQSGRDAGEIKLTATADGLASATTLVRAQPCGPRPTVP